MKEKKKNGNKKLLKIIILIIIVIISIIICVILSRKKFKKQEDVENDIQQGITLYDTKLSEYVKETESGIKINVSPKLNQDKKIGNLTITNIQLTSSKGIATLLADVTNTSNENTEFKNIKAIFLDEEGKEIYTAKGVIPALKIGQSTRLNISMSDNIVSYDVKFEEK